MKSNLNALVLVLTCASWLARFAAAQPGLAAVNIYVDAARGSDSYNGATPRSAVKTLLRAQQLVRRLRAGARSDVVVNLRGGLYTLRQPVVFTALDSGLNGHTITYTAYHGEQPVVSGGMRVAGWTVHDRARNIWQARVPLGATFRQIYVNGIEARRARTQGTLTTLSKAPLGYTTTDESLQRFANQSDMEVVDEPMPWMQMRLPIASIVGQNITLQQPALSVLQQQQGLYGHPVWLENAYELLVMNDEPGTWYLNRAKHTLYYIPRRGENMHRAVCLAPRTEGLIELRGTAANPVHGIRFAGITFQLANWLRPSTGDGLVCAQANQYSGSGMGIPGAALDVTFAHDVVVQDCTFRMLGGDGINVTLGCARDIIRRCTFHDCAASAIQIARSSEDQSLPPGDPRITGDITVTDCVIHNVATDYQEGCGIFVGMARRVTLAHNTLYDLPYTGISLGWGWGGAKPAWIGSNRILNNCIHDHMRVLTDGGGIYCNGFEQNGLIRGNWIYNQSHPYGEIYLDDGSANWTVTGNVCSTAHAEPSVAASVKWLLYKGDNERAYGNYANDPTPMAQNVAGCSIRDTISAPNGAWPAAAIQIMKLAGARHAASTLTVRRNVRVSPGARNGRVPFARSHARPSTPTVPGSKPST